MIIWAGSHLTLCLSFRSSYPDYQEGEPAEREEEDMEEDVQPDVLAADGYELVLPSGNDNVTVKMIFEGNLFV